MIEYKGKMYLTTSDISDRSGLSVRKVYEIQDILPAEGTTPGNYRLYGERAVARAIQIKWFMNMGMRIPQIRKLYEDKELDNNETEVVDRLLGELKQKRKELDDYILILESAKKTGIRNVFSFIDDVPQTDIGLWTEALNNIFEKGRKLLKERAFDSLTAALDRMSITREYINDTTLKISIRGTVETDSAVKSYVCALGANTGLDPALAAMGVAVMIGIMDTDGARDRGAILWDFAIDDLEPRLRTGLEQCRLHKEEVVNRWAQMLANQVRQISSILGFQSMEPILALLSSGDDISEEDLCENISFWITRYVTPVDDAIELLNGIRTPLYDETVDRLKQFLSEQ